MCLNREVGQAEAGNIIIFIRVNQLWFSTVPLACCKTFQSTVLVTNYCIQERARINYQPPPPLPILEAKPNQQKGGGVISSEYGIYIYLRERRYVNEEEEQWRDATMRQIREHTKGTKTDQREQVQL